MTKLYAYGASHSIGYAQKFWSNPRFSDGCYPKVLADQMNFSLVHRGITGSGVDYVIKQVLTEQLDPTETNIALIQLNGNYHYYVHYLENRIVWFNSLEELMRNPDIEMNVKTALKYNFTYLNTDIHQFVEYVTNVNLIIDIAKRNFDKVIFFFCKPLYNVERLSQMASKNFSIFERKLIHRFTKHVEEDILTLTLTDFAESKAPFYNIYAEDKVHYNEGLHEDWAGYLKGLL